MKFFKGIKTFYLDNMKLINKFLLNQIAISIMGMMVSIALSAINRAAMLAGSLVTSLLFVSLLYDNAWDEGARDRNRVSNGRLKYRPFHGAKVALFAYIPTLIFIIPGVFNSTLRLFGIHLIDSVEAICKAVVLFFLNGSYLGFVYAANDTLINNGVDISLFVALACLIPGIVAYLLGYLMGLKDKQIKEYLGMKPSLGDGAKKPTNNK